MERNAEAAAVFRRIGLTIALICPLAAPAAAQQADQLIAGLCRSYASGVKGVPPGSAFDSCMNQRGCYLIQGTANYQCEDFSLQPRHGRGNDW